MRALKDFVRSRPALYDQARRLKRDLTGRKPASFVVLDRFSRARGGQVNFVQIGANDGLRNDPLRPFIVRDDWQGVLIEPLPTVFPLLQRNYAYLKRPELVMINAAITVSGQESLSFWTFNESFLAEQPLEQRLEYERKASFEREHVAAFLPPQVAPETALASIAVPCLTLEEVVDTRLARAPLHLLAIDVEGYEAELIPAIDFSRVSPDAVFFESEHLGPARERVFGHLREHGYAIESVGLDSLALR